MTLAQLALDALACPGLPPNDWILDLEGPLAWATGGHLLRYLTIPVTIEIRDGVVFMEYDLDDSKYEQGPNLAIALCRVVVARGRW